MTEPTPSEPAASTDVPATAGTPAAPHVVAPKRRSVSWIWLVPLLVAVVGLSLIVKNWMETGPIVTISFQSANGIEVGQTTVRYRDVVVGVVNDIEVSPDRSRVLVRVRLKHDAAAYIARKGTRFWVVRPRLELTGVSGLNTLLSGAYIGVDTSRTKDHGVETAEAYRFIGLEKPPEITSDKPGTRYTLTAPDLGSLELGSPVYYRRIQVGRVIDYGLAPDGKLVDIQIFVDAPNDKYVTADTRFWNVSGIQLSVGSDGVTVQAGSLASVISGGVEFASADAAITTPAKANTTFSLQSTRQAAMADPDGIPVPINMEFRQSVRGLSVGAPVMFHGLEIGKVTDINLEYNVKIRRFYVLVKTELFPMRFGKVYEDLIAENEKSGNAGHNLLRPMIEHGLRAQLRTGNLLTGQQYIALAFVPDASPVHFDETQKPPLIPTVPGSFDRLQEQVSSLVTKLDAIPFAGISQDLRGALKALTRTLNGLHGVGPQTETTLKAVRKSLDQVSGLLGSAASGGNLGQTLRELGQAAKSLRALADYLQANPSALLRGRPADVLPGH
ncbi:MAG TPA: MlaD family protein [Burkholderiaceae bacterium]|nr:MlaD family protein [Burkholderiaceae bacterium]